MRLKCADQCSFGRSKDDKAIAPAHSIRDHFPARRFEKCSSRIGDDKDQAGLRHKKYPPECSGKPTLPGTVQAACNSTTRSYREAPALPIQCLRKWHSYHTMQTNLWGNSAQHICIGLDCPLCQGNTVISRNCVESPDIIQRRSEAPGKRGTGMDPLRQPL